MSDSNILSMDDAFDMGEPDNTCDDLKQFLLNSTLNGMFPFVLGMKSSYDILKRLNSAIFKLKAVQLDQLNDLHQVAIMMQKYQEFEYNIPYCYELMNAVCELTVELLPQHVEHIGNSLCDRFVIGTGKERLQKVTEMHKGIVMLIKNSEVNRQIAMSTLLATLTKVSGQNVPQQETDVVKKAFKIIKLVDWRQLVESDRMSDMFVLVRSFGLIINTKENRNAHDDWDRKMGREIYHFFQMILRIIPSSRNFTFFAMEIQRYIAFCLVSGVTERPFTPLEDDMF